MQNNKLSYSFKGTKFFGSKSNKTTKTRLSTSKNWLTISILSIWSKNFNKIPQESRSFKYQKNPCFYSEINTKKISKNRKHKYYKKSRNLVVSIPSFTIWEYPNSKVKKWSSSWEIALISLISRWQELRTLFMMSKNKISNSKPKGCPSLKELLFPSRNSLPDPSTKNLWTLLKSNSF